jgi:hypothetical protein
VVEVVAEVEEAEGVEEAEAEAAAEEEGTIRTIYPIYQNRLVYKRLERMIVHFAIRRAIGRGTAMHTNGLRNLYSKSLRNLLI